MVSKFRLWPRQLYWQLMLAVSLALFVAQLINAAMLYNGIRDRAIGDAASAMLGRIAAQSDRMANSGRSLDDVQNQKRRRNAAIAIFAEAKQLSLTGYTRRADLTLGAQEYLQQSSADLSDIQIAIGPVAALPRTLSSTLLQSRFASRLRARQGWAAEEAILFSGRTTSGQWIYSAALVRPRDRGALPALFLQTVLLYIAVLIPLAWIARRIVKPLARLNVGVQQVGLFGAGVPLTSNGPEDIQNLVHSFNAMQDRVSALLREKDVMLGAIGHDLKTPLASMKIRIESIENVDERNKLGSTIDEMNAMLDDILTFAKMGQSAEASVRTDLGALMELLMDEYEDKNITLAEPKQRIIADIRPVLFKRALRNLIDNALKYGGGADVSVSEANGRIVVLVSDDGPGIAPDKIDGMFDAFSREDHSRNKATGGAGLGLTIARAIARNHGGDVSLYNKPDRGLRAEIWLPVSA
jgi:signal transduction histidine kinase